MVTLDTTTLKIRHDTKRQLDTFREYKNESYDEVIRKVLFIASNVKERPEVSAETVESIQRARERLSKGNFLNSERAKRRLALNSNI